MSIHINNSKNQAEHDQLDVTVDGSWSADISSWPRVPIETWQIKHAGMIGLWSTLRYANITMENPPFVNEFPIGNGGISIATMLDYWSVILFELCCYNVLGRSWFSSLRSTHAHTQRHTQTHTHTNKDTNKSRYPWPFLLHFATSVSVFPGVFWYHPVKASSWSKGALPSRENCRLFFLWASSELGPFFWNHHLMIIIHIIQWFPNLN